MIMNDFTEKQKFSKWINYGLFILTVFMLYVSVRASGTPAFLHVLFAGLIPSVLIIFLFFIATLTTNIDSAGISIKFPPLRFKNLVYSWKDMENCEIRTYKPIWEYGGWGIRFGKKGKAYTVRGNKGIQIELKNGKQVLIGTQQTEEIDKLIHKYFKKNSNNESRS